MGVELSLQKPVCETQGISPRCLKSFKSLLSRRKRGLRVAKLPAFFLEDLVLAEWSAIMRACCRLWLISVSRRQALFDVMLVGHTFRTFDILKTSNQAMLTKAAPREMAMSQGWRTEKRKITRKKGTNVRKPKTLPSLLRTTAKNDLILPSYCWRARSRTPRHFD